MPLSMTEYKRMMADPKRSEAARRAAWTRLQREKLHGELYRAVGMEHGIREGKERYALMADMARLRGGAYLQLLGTKWLPGTVKEVS